jgi:anthranilate synthase/aminodeoxychorismate synthase-like glutamine amidotransferase
MILVIDNYDSFTYNLVQQIEGLGFRTTVWLNDQCDLSRIQALKPERIVLSPGPKTPNEAGVCLEVIEAYKDRCPILGVCLGHQALGMAFGASLGPSKDPFHGSQVMIETEPSVLFQNLPRQIKVARYHSLALQSAPDMFRITARDEHDEIMAIEHKEQPLFGVQFHPESFMSDSGNEIVRQFCQYPLA